MENQYYTPELEDLHIGYECEIKEAIFEINKQDFDFNYQLNDNRYSFGKLTPYSLTKVLSIKKLNIRTPYLTKEQIEQEGWKYHFIEDHNDKYNFDDQFWTKKGHQLRVYYGNINGGVWNANYALNLKSIRITIDDTYGGRIYSGSCPSINEFRKIMKLLNIK